MSDFRVLPVGDSCLLVVFEEKIDPAISARCVAVARALERKPRPGIRDVVPAYNTVAVYFDPLILDRRSVAAELELLAAVHATAPEHDGPLLNIPESEIIVCGMALGHIDPGAPVNALVTERAPISDFTTFVGL